jgi:hypothetical protein
MNFASLTHHRFVQSFGLGLALCLTACSGTQSPTLSDSTTTDTVIFQSLPPGALPPGAKILTEQTLVMGSGENWLGRVNLDIGKDSENAYRYFVDQYPKQGWTLLSTSRGQLSLLVFTKDTRTASIQITENSVLLPGKAVITVSPRIPSMGSSYK